MRHLFPTAFLTFQMLPLAAQPPSGDKPLHISPPNKHWAFEIAAPGFRVTKVGPENGRWQLTAERDQFVLSVSMEQVKGKATINGCKDSLRERAAIGHDVFSAKEVKQSQRGDTAVLEYTIGEIEGTKVNQRNLFGCFAREDVYIDVHVSKVAFKTEDQLALDVILNSSQMVNGAQSATAPANSTSLFTEGNQLFSAGQFEKSIRPYEVALDLEKKQSSFSNLQWRILVDNLAMAYGISGNENAALTLLEYGVSKDPKYPMFYYIMANVYGEKGDLNNTLKYLTLALSNKQGMNPGEKLPDPIKDDSFKQFVKDESFRKLAAEFR